MPLTYGVLLSNKFFQALDQLKAKTTNLKTVIGLIHLSDEIRAKAKTLDHARNHLIEKFEKAKKDSPEKEAIYKQLLDIQKEPIVVAKLVVDGIENLNLDGLLLEQLRYVIEIPGLQDFVEPELEEFEPVEDQSQEEVVEEGGDQSEDEGQQSDQPTDEEASQ